LAYFSIKKGIGHYGSYFENQEILLNSVIDVISGTTSECLLANFFLNIFKTLSQFQQSHLEKILTASTMNFQAIFPGH
jgi:hypothetical protein